MTELFVPTRGEGLEAMRGFFESPEVFVVEFKFSVTSFFGVQGGGPQMGLSFVFGGCLRVFLVIGITATTVAVFPIGWGTSVSLSLVLGRRPMFASCRLSCF